MPRMTADQYRAFVEKHGIHKMKAGKILAGVPSRTSRNWMDGTSPVPFAVALVASFMELVKLTPDEVEALGERWRDDKSSEAAAAVDKTIDDKLRKAIVARLQGRQGQIEPVEPVILSPRLHDDDGIDLLREFYVNGG